MGQWPVFSQALDQRAESAAPGTAQLGATLFQFTKGRTLGQPEVHRLY